MSVPNFWREKLGLAMVELVAPTLPVYYCWCRDHLGGRKVSGTYLSVCRLEN